MTRPPRLHLVPAASAAEPAQVLRFAFAPGINPAAQAVLARFFDAFASSLDGVEHCRTHFDEGLAEWVATLEGTGAEPIRDAGERLDGRHREKQA